MALPLLILVYFNDMIELKYEKDRFYQFKK